MSILHKLFHKIETERPFPNSFYESTITLKPKPHKYSTTKKRENYRRVSHMDIDVKFLNKTVANQIQENIKKTIHHDQVRFISEMQE